jgi:cyclophilin family peptidyl-prolyl cis-trans isomerase
MAKSKVSPGSGKTIKPISKNILFMSKNTILWVVIGVLLVGAVAFALTRKSAGTGEDGATQATSAQPADTKVTTEKDKPMTSQDNNNCTRNYDPKKFAGKQVDFQNKVVTLTVRGFGDVKIALNDKEAPKTSENFVKLAESGFYDCLTFHRVAKDFVIQGGDPDGTGMGGPGYTIPAEIKLPHVKGAVAMARTSDQVNPKRESSGSQFYIALQPLAMLDGAYTVFGQVVEGMDVVEKIGAVEILGGSDGPPKTPVIIEKVTVASK